MSKQPERSYLLLIMLPRSRAPRQPRQSCLLLLQQRLRLLLLPALLHVRSFVLYGANASVLA